MRVNRLKIFNLAQFLSISDKHPYGSVDHYPPLLIIDCIEFGQADTPGSTS